MFFLAGTKIEYSSYGSFGGTVQPTYAELMTATDRPARHAATWPPSRRSASEGAGARNLVVPVVGDFAGPKALRAIGRYVAKRGATVSAFYVSNVEEYLRQDGVWPTFCANVASLPIDAGSPFIRAVRATERRCRPKAS